MIQLALLLFGAGFVRRNAYLLMLVGLAWLGMGLAIFIDGLDGVHYFPLKLFGTLLLAESLVTLLVASSGLGAQKAVLLFKGGLFLLIAVLILADRTLSNFLMAMVFGLAYFVLGVFQIASAWVVRYERWRKSIWIGIAQIIFGILTFQPYPTNYAGTVSTVIGVTVLVAGLNTLRTALRARHLGDDASMSDLIAPEDLRAELGAVATRAPGSSTLSESGQDLLTVHVWTPEGSARNATVRRPVINRYIAAVDVDGVISTGHAALEMTPGTYISLYPAVEIDRSPSEFFNLLKAVKENDVPGTYQPDYATESKAWCPSSRKIEFMDYNREGLLAFWNRYRQAEVYNLTRRNCSSSVSYALESALDGVLAERGRHRWQVMRILLMPELWIAAQIRRRAQVMAWTPGLTLDYCRALRAIVHPVERPWFSRLLRTGRRERRG
jgi:hypothetical protein